MKAKKTLLVILILSIIATSAVILSGCKLTNDGSEDELKGVYGVTTMYYSSYEGKKYNSSGQYEYFLLVLNGDEGRTGKVIMKRDGDAEFSYDITYTPNFNTDNKTIWSITVNDFRLPEYADETGAISYSAPSKRVFRFYPMLEKINFIENRNDVHGTIWSSNYIAFRKFAKNTNEKNINEVKAHQIRTKESRAHDVDEGQVFGTYGVNEMYYISSDNTKYNVSGKFKYFIIALNELNRLTDNDGKGSGKVIFKRGEDDEETYEITFELKDITTTNGYTKVGKVTIKGFKLPIYDETGEVTFGEPQDVTFIHDVMEGEVLSFTDETTGKSVLTFKRTYPNVSEVSIEQTKSQQKQSQEARGQ